MVPDSAAEAGATVTVVGGGIAGLVAAISCAEADLAVVLHEARSKLGGRALSNDGDWKANFGPHALCSRRSNWGWLKDRRLLPRTAWISPTGSCFHYGGRVHRTPPLALQSVLARARRQAPDDVSFADWAQSQLGRRPARAVARLAAASFSYHHDPGQLAAAFVWDRVRWMFMPPAVHRVVGGWGTLVEGLADRAMDLGVRIEHSRSVDALPPPPVIVAVELADAAKLLGRELSWPSGGGVALDLGLESRRGDPGTILDLDHGVLVQAQPRGAAPDGHRLYQAHCGLAPGQGPDEGIACIENVFDNACRGWRGRTAWRRRMVVEGRTGAVDYPGATWSERPAIDQGSGVFLAGDMVAAEGLLSEVSFNSARKAARLAVAWVGVDGRAA